MRTIIAMLLLCSTAQADWGWNSVRRERRPVRQAAVDNRPKCIIITSKNCAPCERLKRRLATIQARRDVNFMIVDVKKWNEVSPANAVTFTPNLFLYRTNIQGRRYRPSVPGRAAAPYLDVSPLSGRDEGPVPKAVRGVKAYLFGVERTTRVETVPLPPVVQQRQPTSRPYLSVNGLSPNALHHATVSGSPAIVEPNTEAEWRRHVGEDHGYRNAYAMSPQQLAQAHTNAHGQGYTTQRTTQTTYRRTPVRSAVRRLVGR